MALGAYHVPQEEQEAAIDAISKLDITRIADKVMQTLFSALAMRFEFSLSDPSPDIS